MQPDSESSSESEIDIELESPKGEAFLLPKGAKRSVDNGVAISSIVRITEYRFRFKEVKNTPGRRHTKKVALNLPPGAGAFVCVSSLAGAFVTADVGEQLRERPLGQYSVWLYFEGNNLVCSVRLTDKNGDDPMAFFVAATVVYFLP